MFKRVGAIVLTVVMMLTMVFSTFAVPGKPLSLKVRLENGVTQVAAGKTITVYVDLVGSAELCGLTVLGTYDTDVFELREEDIVATDIDGMGCEISGNPIQVVWFCAYNIPVSGRNLLKITFTAKENVSDSQEVFSFRFKEDGVTHINDAGNPVYMIPGTDFVPQAAQSPSVTVGKHIYTNACDAECDDCGAKRVPADHVYKNDCDVDCNVCGEKRTIQHSYANNCDTDCNVCGEKRTIQHSYVNDCDTDCNVCGKSRTTSHNFGAYVYNGDATVSKDGTGTQTCKTCGHKEIVPAPGTMLKNPFNDIGMTEYFTEPVLWAVSKKITNGTSETSFSPNQTCTRGQIVTFLWRAAGEPEPKNSRNPFVDVSSDQYYYKAVLWAVENGVTTGIDESHFAPDAFCTRGQSVTFIWRAMGKPSVSSANPFGDVAGGAYYYDAVLWAVKNEITNGTSPTTFAPESFCTRGQIVTFLHRAYK